jgi:GNAT superfamily N-acetyltransferase
VTTHVCLDEPGLVNAFFALKTIVVSVDGFSSRLRRGSTAEGHATGILLCQTGVELAHQGGGNGKALLKAAMQMAAGNHGRSPLQLFVVDAADDGLVGWYSRAGLVLVPGTRRLVMPMTAVVKALGQA